MKKNYLPLLMMVPILFSCGQNNELIFVPYDKEINPLSFKEEDNSLYYRHQEVNPLVTKLGNFHSFQEFLYDSKDNRHHVLANPLGERKMLVLPIRFTNSSDDIPLEKKTIYLQNAFFGDEKTTTGQSVASFYHQSSYGQLKISGEVAPWYTLNYRSDQWRTISGDQTSTSRKITVEALNNLRNNEEFDLSSFDSDKDGYIDMIYVIYDYPYNNINKDDSGEDLFWAYTDFISENENYCGEGQVLANAYSWSSLYFSLPNKGQRVDASTYIHETGHLFGLTDYYNTKPKQLGYYYQPTGFLDMMDSNQGDHTALSKYLLNWTPPKVIKKGINGVIKLNNFSQTGDYLLLPLNDKYDDNPFGEYLLLEYFVPSGLNKSNGLSYQDEDINGNKVIFTLPDHHGLKVYHVNTSLGYFSKYKKVGDEPKLIYPLGEEGDNDVSQYAIDFIYHNSIKSKDAETGTVLYHLLESSGQNTFKDGLLADNNTFFHYGESFGVNNYQDLATKCGYTFKIVDISTKDISIEFKSL